MEPDNAPELTARKPRTTGKLVWFRSGMTDSKTDLEVLDQIVTKQGHKLQPPHEDIAAARKWLGDEVESDNLEDHHHGAQYTLCRVICTVTPRLEVTKKAVL